MYVSLFVYWREVDGDDGEPTVWDRGTGADSGRGRCRVAGGKPP
jgi:hypothetical protein